MLLKKLLAGFFLIGFGWSVQAQNSKCEETLNQATEEFSAGHFYEIPKLLKPCLDKNDFTNEQRVRAYLLLTQTYLILDKPTDADASYLKLLKADPEYIATPEKDPIDVVYLSKKFTSTPIFTPHARIGLNTSLYRSIGKPLTTSGLAPDIQHGLRVGFQLGAGMDWNITNNWSLSLEGVFSTKSFKETYKGIFEDPITKSGANLVVTEKHVGIDVPLYLKYASDKGNLRPFGYVGIAANFLFSSKSQFIFVDQTVTPKVDGNGKPISTNTSQTAQGPDEIQTYQRRTTGRSIVLGGGFKYKIGKDYLFMDVRYMAGFNNFTTPNIYSTKNGTGPNQLANYVVQYTALSSYYRLDNLLFSIGYIRPIYDPRKIKKVRSITHLFHRKNEAKK